VGVAGRGRTDPLSAGWPSSSSTIVTVSTFPGIDELLAPGYLEGLAQLPMDELRGRRDTCTEAEVSLSYVRRVVQGRLDIVLAERSRRQAGAAGGAEKLIDDLPGILSEKVHAPGLGRLPTLMAPSEVGPEATVVVDAVAPLDRIGAVGDVADDDLQAMSNDLQRLEREVSDKRRGLHDLIDQLQGEVIRRYQTGEVNVDSLLR
jgi:hypothetical protein